jgi:hypothetical protein
LGIVYLEEPEVEEKQTFGWGSEMDRTGSASYPLMGFSVRDVGTSGSAITVLVT